MYAHPACPTVYPVQSVLKWAEVEFEYINILDDLAARQTVRDINNGYESVPTLVFPDGSTLTEPSANELRHKLQSLGYAVPFMALVTGNLWTWLLLLGVILAIVRLLGIF
jgi:mycoredoxin